MKGLGNRIRDLRKSRRLTLVEVSRSTGIDQATLSRIENGKMTGTLDSHRRIAEVMGIRLTELYDTVMQNIAQAGDKKKTRQLDTFSHSSGAIAELLATGILQKRMMPVLLKIKGKGRTETEELPSYTERFIYVLRGSVDVVFGKESKTLKQDESLYFGAAAPHSFKNRLKTETRLLSVITPTSL